MNKLFLILPVFVLAGCASSFDREQDKLYQVSMAQYQDYNCGQLKAEMSRLSGLIDQQEVSIKKEPKGSENQYLDAAVTALAITMGQYNSSNEDKQKATVISRLKSQYNGLDQLFIRKNCVYDSAK